MAIALYDDEVGYYARPRSPLGAGGDYFTSPQLHPAFAVLLARPARELWERLGQPRPFVLHESGPGSGLFARDLLDWLRQHESALYAALAYRLHERSPARRREQRRWLARAEHLERVAWVDAFSTRPPANLVFANELLDALPVHLVRREAGRLVESYVGLERDRLVLVSGPPSTDRLAAYFERLGLLPAEGCQAEVNLAAVHWLAIAARGLGPGLLLVLDYGYPAERLYAPERRSGTLLSYYRHTLGSDPLIRVGQQDLTSHVDFTTARLVCERAGLTTLGLVSQRRLLGNLGLADLIAGTAAADLPQAERDANLRALEALGQPDGLGRLLAYVAARGLADYAPLGLVGQAEPWRPPGLPLRGPEHLLLPGPESLDGLPDFEAQWSEFWNSSQAQ
jgi:SAM-dependent MidA family methyltransferase